MSSSSSASGGFSTSCVAGEICNYPANKKKKTVPHIPYTTLLNVLRREETLRLCPELQSLYDRHKHPPCEIESELQRICLRENGLCRCWLDSYWETSYRYPLGTSRQADQVRSTTVWLRHYERFIEDDEVPVRVGDKVPDISLLALAVEGSRKPVETTTRTSIRQFLGPKPLVVVAGSAS